MYNIYRIIEAMQFVPKIANTHYYYQTYENPALVPFQKTVDIKGRPQVKTPNKKLPCNKNESAILTPAQSAAPMPQPETIKVARKKYRKNVNKQALAEYFDNSNKNTESQQWLDNVVAELNRQDANRRAAEATDRENLREFVESTKTQYIIVTVVTIATVANTLLKIIAEHNAQQDTISAREKINADILDKFERRMQHVSQARGMKKMHDIHKLRQNQK